MKKLLLLLAVMSFTCTLSAQVSSFSEEITERLYVHLSKPYVLAGETLYFRIFHVTSKELKPEPLSKIAYVELFDTENRPVSQVRVRMDAAGGWGHIELPADVNSGRYMLRAYTQWMRNGPESKFFHVPVQVINTFKRLGLNAPDTTPVVSLFAEGGDLVYGLTSRAGLTLRSSSGDPLSTDFKLLSGDSVTGNYRSDEMGLAVVELTPVPGKTVSAVLSNDTIPVKMRQPGRNGTVLKVTDRGSYHSIELESRQETDNGSSAIVVVSRGQVRHQKQVNWDKGRLTYRLEREVLAPGVNQITVLDNGGNVLGERLVYIRPDAPVDISLQQYDQSYQRRETFTMKIDINGAGINPEADLSVSVYLWDPLFGTLPVDINTYFHLTSELAGLYHLPENYLADEENIERLMLTYGWRRYDQPAAEDAETEYLPEFRLPVIRGSVSGAGVPLFASMPESREKLFIAKSDVNGQFSFELPNVRDNSRMIIQSRGNLDITIDDPFDARLPASLSGSFMLSEEIAKTLRQANINLQVRKHFVDPPSEENVSGEPFYGQPDVSYLLDEFTRFPVMEEVFREYVYGAYLRKRDGEYNLFVLDEASGDRMNNEPLILLDGVPVFDTDRIIELDPLRIEQIDVVRRKYGYGPYRADGIVALYSYDRDLAGYTLPANSVDRAYQAAQQYKEYYVPQHVPGEKNTLPDFRNQVFWKPRILTSVNGSAEISFSLPDNTGQFRIVVQGMTSDGSFGSSTATFSIRQ